MHNQLKTCQGEGAHFWILNSSLDFSLAGVFCGTSSRPRGIREGEFERELVLAHPREIEGATRGLFVHPH